MGCLVSIFKQPFSIFKQYFTHFYTLFHPHVFLQKFSVFTQIFSKNYSLQPSASDTLPGDRVPLPGLL